MRNVYNSNLSTQLLENKITSQWNSPGYWGNKNDYYDQNWVWFGTALATNNLPNLWNN